jgi:hypothetical protein
MYDDNFGHWHSSSDPEVRAFYRETSRRSVVKECESCKRKVRLLPQYSICNRCADMAERGY